MTPQDLPAFSARLSTLAELLGCETLSETRLLLYYEACADLELPAVLAAMTAVGRTWRYAPRFPPPAELRAVVLGDDETRIERTWLAWRAAAQQVGAYSSLVCEDPALADTLLALWGSWPAACVADLSPEMWAAKRKEFGRVYRVMTSRPLAGPRCLPGRCEEHNGRRSDVGWVTFVPVAALDRAGEIRWLTAAERLAIAADVQDTAQACQEKLGV